MYQSTRRRMQEGLHLHHQGCKTFGSSNKPLVPCGNQKFLLCSEKSTDIPSLSHLNPNDIFTWFFTYTLMLSRHLLYNWKLDPETYSSQEQERYEFIQFRYTIYWSSETSICQTLFFFFREGTPKIISPIPIKPYTWKCLWHKKLIPGSRSVASDEAAL